MTYENRERQRQITYENRASSRGPPRVLGTAQNKRVSILIGSASFREAERLAPELVRGQSPGVQAGGTAEAQHHALGHLPLCCQLAREGAGGIEREREGGRERGEREETGGGKGEEGVHGCVEVLVYRHTYTNVIICGSIRIHIKM